jgi:hypothetical protein
VADRFCVHEFGEAQVIPDACRTRSTVLYVVFLLFQERGKEEEGKKEGREQISSEWVGSCQSTAPRVPGLLCAKQS